MQHFSFYKSVKILIAFFTPFLAMAGPAQDFRTLVFEETKYFILEKVDFDKKNMFLSADYNYKPLDKKVTLLLQYGEDDVIAEKTQVLRSAFKLHYGVDNSALRDTLSRSEMGDIYDRLKELYNYKGYIKWQKQHGTLLNDHPETDLFPLEYNSFSILNFNFRLGEIKANYRIADSDGNLRITLMQGEGARQYAQSISCGTPEEITLDGVSFYRNQDRDSYVLQTKLDNIFLSVTNNFGEEGDKAPAKSKTKSFIKNLDLNRIDNFDYPGVEGPGKDMQPIAIDADDFKSFFPEKSGDLRLQEVYAYPDAMHLRVDYLYEPENHVVSLHMAYGNYRARLKTRSLGSSIGNFHIQYETGCLGEKIGRDKLREVVSNIPKPDEGDIVRWEMEHIDFAPVNSLAGYFPVAFGKFSVASFSPDDDELEVRSEYSVSGREKPISFNVVYGEEAAKKYNRYQLTMFEEKNKLRSVEIGGLTFEVVDIGKGVLAAHYHDQLLIGASMEKAEEDKPVRAIINDMEDFLTGFDVSRLMDWEAPDNYEKEFDDTLEDGTKICVSAKCMDEHLSRCEPAAFGGRLNRSLGVIYKIEESREGRCRMSMTYTANPNEEWEDKPLYFYVESGESFKNVVKEKIEECLEGDGANCEGPLLDIINQ